MESPRKALVVFGGAEMEKLVNEAHRLLDKDTYKVIVTGLEGEMDFMETSLREKGVPEHKILRVWANNTIDGIQNSEHAIAEDKGLKDRITTVHCINHDAYRPKVEGAVKAREKHRAERFSNPPSFKFHSAGELKSGKLRFYNKLVSPVHSLLLRAVPRIYLTNSSTERSFNSRFLAGPKVMLARRIRK